MIVKLVLSASISFLFVSCGHIYTNKDTYQAGKAVEVNGAKVSAAVQPEGASSSMGFSAMVYMAGGAKLHGPFSWRIEAEGKEGTHSKMMVHRVKVATLKTQREEWFPQDRLGGWADFEALSDEPGKAFASYRFPGVLEVYPEKDGPFTVTVDVSIQSQKRTVRKLIRFSMGRTQQKEVDFLFLPAEIVKGFDSSPRDWEFGNPL